MPGQSEMLRRWAQQSQSARHINAILKQAAVELSLDVYELDSHFYLLNLRNGTLVFSREGNGQVSFKLKPHDSKDYITKLCPVDYDPNAECPTYDAAFAQVQPDPEIRNFLHRVVGYAATGDTSEQKLFFFYGGGRNGKSTFVDCWSQVLGNYAATIPVESFLAGANPGNGGQPSPHMARLRGVRLLRTSEAERDAVLAEALIKLATSGEPMMVRELNRDPFELRPQFKLIMSGNYKPKIRGADDGIWRRIVLVPWSVKIPELMIDRHLSEKLKAEGSGILNHIIEGIRSWMQEGLKTPQAILEATAEYRTSSDHLGRFLEECCRNTAGSRVSAHDLRALYFAWAAAAGAPTWTPTGFGLAMRDRGYKNTKSGNHYWLDIELIKSPDDFKPNGAPIPQEGSGPPVDPDDPISF